VRYSRIADRLEVADPELGHDIIAGPRVFADDEDRFVAEASDKGLGEDGGRCPMGHEDADLAVFRE
jgi:hypothetical protein